MKIDHVALYSLDLEGMKEFFIRCYQVLSGPRTTGDGYYESCIVGLEKILIEITV